MTEERVQRAFREHPAFEQSDDEASESQSRFETTFTPFAGVVTATDAEGEDTESDTTEYRVAVRTPVLDAVVEGEEVAEVVQSGWFETLELRLEDAHTVADAEEATPPTVEREGEEVVVRVTFERDDPERAAEDAKAIVEYVEGTWVQGLIPGYDYREPAAQFRERAHQNYDEGGANGRGGSDGQGGSGDRPGGSGAGGETSR